LSAAIDRVTDTYCQMPIVSAIAPDTVNSISP